LPIFDQKSSAKSTEKYLAIVGKNQVKNCGPYSCLKNIALYFSRPEFRHPGGNTALPCQISFIFKKLDLVVFGFFKHWI
jgi:hypothetical protein